MSERLPTRIDPEQNHSPVSMAEVWGGYRSSPEEEEEGGIPWARSLAALRRYKWLMAAIIAVGAVAGARAYSSSQPMYTATGALWIKTEGQGGGAVRDPSILRNTAWVDLLRSAQVMDTVAVRLRLNLHLAQTDPFRPAFENFSVEHPYVPGNYVLHVAPDGRSWSLRSPDGAIRDEGEVGTPIGSRLGFRWEPSPARLIPGGSVSFSLVSPADASRALNQRLQHAMNPEAANFLRLNLSGTDPVRVAEILNALMERHVELADRLKRTDLERREAIVGAQLAQIEAQLAQADQALERFRVSTITLPSDQPAPLIPGLGMTQDPVVAGYHQMRVEAEEKARERDLLRQIVSDIPSSGVRVEALDIMPVVASSSRMRQALGELNEAQARERILLMGYLPEHPEVIQIRDRINHLERTVIPEIAELIASELDDDVSQLQGRISSSASEIATIPVRTIQQAQLQRQQANLNSVYETVRQSYEEARLAAATLTRDVEIHDRATIPEVASADQRLRMALLALLASIGIAVGTALLLDRLDKRIRYPDQVNHDLGLEILGAVPRIVDGTGKKARESRDQVLEAFRDLRLNLEYAYGAAGPLVVTFTSPGEAEGKSLIATNLALAFAETGRKTLLIDADTRRGDAHKLLGASRKPGLVELLRAEIDLSSAIQETDFDRLHFIGSGARVANSPELLGTPFSQRTMGMLRASYEVILIDSPPLGAGSDAFVLASLAGNLALILRTGTSDRVLMRSRMQGLSRLPIRVLGAILNDVEATGMYKYYANYIPGYAAGEEETSAPLKGGSPPKALTEGSGARG